MFSTEEYIFGWFFYLSAITGLLLILWRVTRGMLYWPHTRRLLRLSIAILLLTPYVVDKGSDYFAPAWAMASLDILFSGINAFWRAGGPLLVVWCAAILFYFLLTVAYKVLKMLSAIR